MSERLQTTISPIDGTPYTTRLLPDQDTLESVLKDSQEAFVRFKTFSLQERMAIVAKFLEELEKNKEQLAVELTEQMGRPTAGCRSEVMTSITRGKFLLSVAESSLADVTMEHLDTPEHIRWIQKVPIGPVLIITPWNYPYLCQINAVVAAVLAGNSVILKPSPQTPLAAERFVEAFLAAGLPENVVQTLHATPTQVEQVIKDSRIQFVMFTGSVAVGHAVVKAASDTFKNVGLELGGKDPAYVRADADLEKTVGSLVSGAIYNAGQSCCAVEASSRIYVHSSIADAFIAKYVERVKQYKLGDPRDPSITLGPVVSLRSAATIRKQLHDAERAGAKLLIPADWFPTAKDGTTWVAPQVVVNCDHSMDIMKEETFGPVIGIMTVDSDEEAIRLMNDSPFGLTASIWTDGVKSRDEFIKIAAQLETGTVLLNEADTLDPALAWSGLKDSGRGISMSQFAFDAFIHTKSFNLHVI